MKTWEMYETTHSIFVFSTEPMECHISHVSSIKENKNLQSEFRDQMKDSSKSNYFIDLDRS